MNFIAKSFLLWAIFLTGLVIFGATTVKVDQYIYSLIFLLFFTFFFLIGSRISSGHHPRMSGAVGRVQEFSYAQLLALSLLSLSSAVYSGFYYTGMTPLGLLILISTSGSAYNSYQEYIGTNDLTKFTLEQVVPFLLLIFGRLCFLFVIYYVLVRPKIHGRAKYILILINVLAFAYGGATRGTTIEFFEMAVYFFLCNHYARNIRKSKVRWRFVSILLMSAGAVAIFYYNQSARSGGELLAECTTRDICFDTNAFLHDKENIISILIYRLNGYFSFGIYFVNGYIENLMRSDWGAASLLVPPQLLHDGTARSLICGVFMDCAANWIPDVALHFERMGLILLILMTIILGWTSGKLDRAANDSVDFPLFILIYYLMLQVMSMFVGNFITSNQASLAVLMIAIFAFTARRVSIGL